MKNNKITSLYERLGRDDDLEYESNSISHQKQMLEEYTRRNGIPNSMAERQHCQKKASVGGSSKARR